LRAPRGYSVGSRPVTFGEMPSATKVKGLRMHAVAAGGTLHAQCVLRGHGASSAEEVTMAALAIATPGTVELMFPKPLVINGPFERCTVEPWLVWSGQTHLILAEIPAIIS
jgi:hypothetical protein